MIDMVDWSAAVYVEVIDLDSLFRHRPLDVRQSSLVGLQFSAQHLVAFDLLHRFGVDALLENRDVGPELVVPGGFDCEVFVGRCQLLEELLDYVVAVFVDLEELFDVVFLSDNF